MSTISESEVMSGRPKTTTMLTRIKIQKLFDLFDYDIALKQEKITVFTGSNGSGKTTLLKTIHALASKNVWFFISLTFEKIEFYFEDNTPLIVTKKDTDTVTITNGGQSGTISKKELYKNLKDVHPLRYSEDEGIWRDHRSGRVLTSDQIFSMVSSDKNVLGEILKPDIQRLLSIPMSAYLIREQRLLIPRMQNSKYRRPYDDLDEPFEAFTDSIEEYSREFQETFRDTLAKASVISQELDRSFPKRLFDQAEGITETEFQARFEKIKEQQSHLAKYELLSMNEDADTTYKAENAKALKVYIEDAEKKMAVFSDLLKKLEIFTDILNKRRFSHKKIKISKEGFVFETARGQLLPLKSLSSGEQQEIVLLYELLFKTKPGTLVLIDEPEISLHVVWQQAFLDDCFQIAALQNLTMIIATHSPQIIDDYWDLTVDLDSFSPEI